MRDFWRSSGFHLLDRTDEGDLGVTPDFIRAYLARPEVVPQEDSCEQELALYTRLMEDPLAPVSDGDIARLEDEDAQYNYRIVLRFRDLLIASRTLEAAYLTIAQGKADVPVPPLFASQLVHAILRNILNDCDDALRVRAGELFFREQNVSTEGGRLMLADDEIVEMHAKSGGMGGIGQLLAESNTPVRQVEMDVLDEDNKSVFWDRSERFDTVVDFRFTQPALDGFARVLEAWIGHFFKLPVKIQPMQRIDDERWSWHIGLDLDATQILNGLYRGEEVSDDDLNRIVALFRMEVLEPAAVLPAVRGKPVYLGLAMTRDRKVKMKPQNLLTNLPLENVT